MSITSAASVPATTITIRPELRLEHAYDPPAFDLGHKKTQFTVAGDLIYHF
jgi:hypothetical protein